MECRRSWNPGHGDGLPAVSFRFSTEETARGPGGAPTCSSAPCRSTRFPVSVWRKRYPAARYPGAVRTRQCAIFLLGDVGGLARTCLLDVCLLLPFLFGGAEDGGSWPSRSRVGPRRKHPSHVSDCHSVPSATLDSECFSARLHDLDGFFYCPSVFRRNEKLPDPPDLQL